MKHVAVLMGGWSVEREVSLVTGAACADALEACGFRVTRIDVDRNLATRLTEVRPDVVFNALHGRFGEDGTVQGMLEMMGIPYTHSGVLASAIAINKPAAKALFREAGIPTPDGEVLTRRALAARSDWQAPLVIKPINEGSSVGVDIILEGDNIPPLETGDPEAPVLVERYIPGREVQVAVAFDEVLGAIEILSPGRFYDYEAKYAPGGSRHVMPAPLPEADYSAACEISLLAHRLLGCRGITRSDLRYDDTGEGPAKLFLLEVNTQPGMTPTSLAPEIALHQGIDFETLCTRLVEDASCDR
ncbi:MULTISPECIES: D-alanine--D-alanine ligase [unclassified Minwuia]|jgi:D-alanine-D-alanine ligase|uniref:D-alanine--D-alanine ligase n=1 Tax=unclassified Minwuia TaxID=2618799 RepID=UPI00247B1212|nr:MULTISPECIES: D-alanine--D-alanine ligase [unclassified Minwuia]